MRLQNRLIELLSCEARNMLAFLQPLLSTLCKGSVADADHFVED